MTEKERYQQYLCSREWGLLKRAVRERCGGICERCNLNAMDSVHHLTYARKYAEKLEDLQATCEPCHKFTHGLADHDPVLAAPIMVWNLNRSEFLPVRHVYMAGKIDGNDWRQEMVDDPDFLDDVYNQSPSVLLRDGRKLQYCGPYFSDLSGGHGPSWSSDWHARGGPHASILARSIDGIDSADFVFAWIDSEDCYGTLVELGYALANQKTVYLAGPRIFPELWFGYCSADRTCFDFATPREALNAMILDGKGNGPSGLRIEPREEVWSEPGSTA